MSRAVLWLCVLLALGVSQGACAWQYAQEKIGDEQRPDPPPKRVEVITPEVKPPPKVDDNPCKVTTLVIFKLDAGKRIKRNLHCQSGKVMDETVESLSQEQERTFMAMNMPKQTWFLMVDSNGTAPDTITNDQLLGLDKRYTLRFHQRVPDTGLIIYRFEDLMLAP
mgnify:CR=1 FL=1